MEMSHHCYGFFLPPGVTVGSRTHAVQCWSGPLKFLVRVNPTWAAVVLWGGRKRPLTAKPGQGSRAWTPMLAALTVCLVPLIPTKKLEQPKLESGLSLDHHPTPGWVAAQLPGKSHESKKGWRIRVKCYSSPQLQNKSSHIMCDRVEEGGLDIPMGFLIFSQSRPEC